MLFIISPMAWAKSNDKSTVAETELVKITVTATRSERAVKDFAGTVSVIDKEDIERYLVRDIEDLVRFEPGVSVDSSGPFGLSGFRIRGIGGDRVLTKIDGIRIADEFSFGPFQDSNRDFVDVDELKSVEIVRGPASSLYGSDAIGGVVTFITKDPADYLGIFLVN
jgi:hemoglobin/transferrin/lactoferrin receptor protein